MANTEQGDLLLLGAGKLFFDRFDANGDPTGERFLGDCTSVEISTSDELRKRYSSSRASRPLMKSVNVRRTVEVAITFGEFDRDNVALVLMGSNTTNAVVASTGESVDFANVLQDRSYDLGFRNVSNVAISGSVLDTDFAVDAATGRVYIIPGGNIADGDDITVTFDQDGDVSPVVHGGGSNVIEGKLVFRGDPSSGPTWDAVFYKVNVTPDGPLSLIGDDWLEGKIKAECLKTEDHEDLYLLTKRTAPPA